MQVTGGPKFGPLLPGQTVSSSMQIIQDITSGDTPNPEPNALNYEPSIQNSGSGLTVLTLNS